MIIKGRSPTMRHVSRTRRVALDWLFHRINLDPKIQITYVHTRKHLADILTKGTFTRDQWHHLLRLFTIMNNSAFLAAISAIELTSPLSCRSDRCRRDNMEEEDARVVAKSRPTRNLVALTPKRSSQLSSSSSTPQSLRNTGASCSSLDPRSTGRPIAKDSSASNAPTSRVWPEDPDTDTGTGRPVATPNERPTDKGLARPFP